MADKNPLSEIAHSTSGSVLVATFLPGGIASRLVMFPTEAIAAALDWLKLAGGHFVHFWPLVNASSKVAGGRRFWAALAFAWPF